MVEREYLTLEDVLKLHRKIIFDTSALIGFLAKDENIRINDSEFFAFYLINNHKRVDYFIPQSVCMEYLYDKKGTPVKNRYRNILINKLEKEGKILCCGNTCIGLAVEDKDKSYSELKSRYGLGRIDSRVFSWAQVLRDKYGKCAIISNDINGMSKFWQKLASNKIIKKNQLGFLPRVGPDLYERFR
jgi:hypothetical protein